MWRVAAYIMMLVIATTLVLVGTNSDIRINCIDANKKRVSVACETFCKQSFMPVKPLMLYASYAAIMILIHRGCRFASSKSKVKQSKTATL